jgi:hypothetical protein
LFASFLSHVSNIFQPHLKDEVRILSVLRYIIARADEFQRASKDKIGVNDLDAAKLTYARHRLVAFATIEDFHFTLGILINLNWKKPDSLPSWRLFHFDSLNGTYLANNKLNARKFGAFLAGIRIKDLPITEVPVPMQGPGSNTCGLFAAHFLRIFLDDIDKSIEFCTKVCFGYGLCHVGG